MAKKLCLKRYCSNVGSLEVFLVCTLTFIDKNRGVRPIGIENITRRILGCTVMIAFIRNILESAGDIQLFVDQRVGCEAAVQALSSIFRKDDSDVILLLDAIMDSTESNEMFF